MIAKRRGAKPAFPVGSEVAILVANSTISFRTEEPMAVAEAQADKKHNIQGGPAGLLRQDLQVPPDAAVGGAERSGHARAQDADDSGPVEVSRGREAHAGSRRGHHRRRGRAPRAGAGEPRRSGQFAHHQFAVRRHPAHHAGRDRRRAPARRLRHPLRAQGQGRLHRGGRREGDDGARRFHHHRQLGAARPRQSRQGAGDVAGRARHADDQSLPDVVRQSLRREDAERQSRGWRLVRALRHGRAAGRHAGGDRTARP